MATSFRWDLWFHIVEDGVLLGHPPKRRVLLFVCPRSWWNRFHYPDSDPLGVYVSAAPLSDEERVAAWEFLHGVVPDVDILELVMGWQSAYMISPEYWIFVHNEMVS
jgi:hypothetical protein